MREEAEIVKLSVPAGIRARKELLVTRRWAKQLSGRDSREIIAYLQAVKAEWVDDRVLIHYRASGSTQGYFEIFAYWLAHESDKLRKFFRAVKAINIAGKNFEVLAVDGFAADPQRLIMAFGVNITTDQGREWTVTDTVGLGWPLAHEF